MDELTENLQKLNMIRSKFDQNKDLNKTPIYQPGSLSKKQGPSKYKELKVMRGMFNNSIVFCKYFSGPTETQEGESLSQQKYRWLCVLCKLKCLEFDNIFWKPSSGFTS